MSVNELRSTDSKLINSHYNFLLLLYVSHSLFQRILACLESMKNLKTVALSTSRILEAKLKYWWACPTKVVPISEIGAANCYTCPIQLYARSIVTISSPNIKCRPNDLNVIQYLISFCVSLIFLSELSLSMVIFSILFK